MKNNDENNISEVAFKGADYTCRAMAFLFTALVVISVVKDKGLLSIVFGIFGLLFCIRMYNFHKLKQNAYEKGMKPHEFYNKYKSND